MSDATPMSRMSHRAAQLLAVIVAVGWTILAPLYVRARVQLGHWPQKNLDDPKHLGLGVHYELAVYGFFGQHLATLALIVLVFLVVLFNRRNSRPTIVLAMIVIVISVALHAVIGVWFLD